MTWTRETVEAQSSPSSAFPRAGVVTPMHNEAPVIVDVVRGVHARFQHVLCLDDGSTDDFAALARDHVVRHPTYLGQGAALEAGKRYAMDRLDVDFVVTFDRVRAAS